MTIDKELWKKNAVVAIMPGAHPSGQPLMIVSQAKRNL
jgi:hypothetical protein